MPLSDNNKNRGAHGDSSFMLGGVPSSSENRHASNVGSVTYGDLIRQQMQTDEGLAKVLSEFSIGVLAKLVTDGKIPTSGLDWAAVKEEIRQRQFKIVKTERR